MRLVRRPEVYLFVVWSKARNDEARIVADLAKRFTILCTTEVVWMQGEVFARSLTRMYGDALVPNSDKERHCGSGPFLAIVIEDQRPRYRLRRTNRGVRLLNSSIFDARRTYRDWVGGGYKVHASDSVAETERNVTLIFGRRSADFQRGLAAEIGSRFEHDPVGTHGWGSVDQLVMVLEAYGGRVVSPLVRLPHLIVAAPDVWWAEHIAGGQDMGPGLRTVQVAGHRLHVRLVGLPTPAAPVDDAIGWLWAHSAHPRRVVRVLRHRFARPRSQ
jgi:hypothetical protein